jgi:hypothetical protein
MFIEDSFMLRRINEGKSKNENDKIINYFLCFSCFNANC